MVASVLSTSAYAQTKSCCSKPAGSSEVFAVFGKNTQFQLAHQAPLPFLYSSENGKSIQFKTSDGKMGNAFKIKAAKPTKNYVFMIHEWWRLNKSVCYYTDKS